MAEPLVIAVLGAESTGKTTLAAALAERLAHETGLRCTWVGEWLRAWCERQGRTPRPDEQAGIAREQHARIARATSDHDVVVCDTTAVMTAVYSRLLFGDGSVDTLAATLHRRDVHLTLLTALDLPWVADGLQRDGEHVREPVDTALRGWLQAQQLPWALVAGRGELRLQAALDAVAGRLRDMPAPRTGLLSRLAERETADAAWRWACDECDLPQCEHRLLRTRRRG